MPDTDWLLLNAGGGESKIPASETESGSVSAPDVLNMTSAVAAQAIQNVTGGDFDNIRVLTTFRAPGFKIIVRSNSIVWALDNGYSFGCDTSDYGSTLKFHRYNTGSTTLLKQQGGFPAFFTATIKTFRFSCYTSGAAVFLRAEYNTLNPPSENWSVLLDFKDVSGSRITATGKVRIEGILSGATNAFDHVKIYPLT